MEDIMAIFTTAQLDEAEDIIESMPYKAADEYDLSLIHI